MNSCCFIPNSKHSHPTSQPIGDSQQNNACRHIPLCSPPVRLACVHMSLHQPPVPPRYRLHGNHSFAQLLREEQEAKMVDIFGIPFNLVIPDGGAGGEVQQVGRKQEKIMFLQRKMFAGHRHTHEKNGPFSGTKNSAQQLFGMPLCVHLARVYVEFRVCY